MHFRPTLASGGALRRRARLLSTVGLALTVGSFLAACSGGSSTGAGNSAAAPASQQILKIGLSGEPKPVIAGADQSTVGYSLDALIGRGLLAYDSSGKVIPGLAKTYKAVDESTYQFTLRSGLKFNDGTALTAENVKDTLTYLSKPANAARTVAGMSNIASIDVNGDDLTVHLKSNDPDFLQYLADPTAFIAPEKSLNPTVSAYVGDGPFKVKSVQNGVKMILVKNPDYYDASTVKLKEIDLIYYPDDQARTNAIVSGDVDLIDYVPWTSFATIKATSGLTIDAQAGPVMDLEFNVSKGPFANPLVREAVGYAVNRDNVVKAAFFGNAKTAYSYPIPKSSPYYAASQKSKFDYDPDKAKKLLAQAGYPNGFTGTLLASSQYAFHQDTALSVQADLKKIGIDLTLKSPDWATRVQLGTDGEYDVKVNGFAGLVTSPAYIESWAEGPAVGNSYKYDNKELWSALAEGRTGATQDARLAAYEKAYSIMVSDPPGVPLAQRDQGFAYDGKVKGFKTLPGFTSFYSFYSLVNTYIGG